MKVSFTKIKLTLIVMLFAFVAKAQNKCSTSVTYTYPVTQTVSSYTPTHYWFKVTTPGAGNFRLNINVDTAGSGTTNPSNRFYNYEVFTGSCGSFTPYAIDTIASASQTNLIIPLTNTTSTQYYISLRKADGTPSTFTISTARQLYITGQIEYTTGQNDTLSISPIGPSGTQTYTWMPGSLHTAQIVSTATANTTYTVTYSDAFGTLTDTLTARALPVRHPCQLVPNSGFENMQATQYNQLANIQLHSGCGPLTPILPVNTAGPSFWTAPTCGTPDYYNTIFNGSSPPSPVAVPNNVFSNSTGLSPHGGNGYAGFETYGGYLSNYREYVQTPLSCALLSGQRYSVQYWVSRASGSETVILSSGTTVYNWIPSNNIGAYFSTTAIGTGANSNVLTYTPQVNSTATIDNPNDWSQIAGTVTGSGEQFMTIGNFFPDSYTSPYPSTTPSYYFIDDVTITPLAPDITVTTCQSGSVTLTANGAATGHVSWFDGINTYTGNPVTVLTPSTTTTFTCTVDLTSCSLCGTITSTVAVNAQTPCSAANTFTTPASSGTFNASPAYAASNVTIGTGLNYVINCADLRMAAGTDIVVASGATLTISGSWIHACDECSPTSMWTGIVLLNGGVLIVDNSIIEDANNAIYTAGSSTTTPIPSYTVTNSIFNNNTAGIFIDSHQGNLGSNSVYNTVFTSRRLGSHAIANIAATKTNIAAATPLIPSTANPADLTIAGARATYGIYIYENNIANPINVGDKTQSSNLFDNLDYGIFNRQSSLTAKNNVFQNITGNYFDFTGLGMYNNADATSPTRNVLIAGNDGSTVVSGEGNSFINCLIGIYTFNMRELHINNNTFNNETTSTTFTTGGTYATGQFGVLNDNYTAGASAGADAEVLDFANNNVQNYVCGFSLNFGPIRNTNSNSTYLMGNTITGAGTSSNYCKYGLYLSQPTPANAGSSVPVDAISITTNTITNVNTSCIYLTTINTHAAKIGFVQIYNNGELSVKYNPAATTLQSPPIAAIGLYQANQTRITYNSNIRVTGFSGSYRPMQYHAGIYVTTSFKNVINCNTVSNTGECFVFDDNCITASWQNNSMDYAQYGLVLRSSGILGNQGSLSYPIGNTWNASAHFTYHTLADASDPHTGTTSELFTNAPACGGTTTEQPCTNTSANSGFAYATSGALPITLNTITSGSNTLTCGAAGTGDRMTNSVNSNSEASNDSLMYQNIQNTLNTDATSYPVHNYQTRWSLQHMVSSNLPTLTPATGYEHAKVLALADAALANQDYGNALSLTNSFSASNIIESNWQSVNNIMVKLQNDTLNNNDISTLQTVAAQCSHDGGSIVFNARALLNSHFRSIIEYPNDCPITDGEERVQNATSINKLSANKNQLSLYPNPSNGKLYISNFDAAQKNVDIEITDITGKLVVKQQSQISNGLVELNLDVNNGVYFVKVISANGNIQMQKVIINK